MILTSRERLMRIFRNEEIDRPAFKLWGARLNTEYRIHDAYLPINHLAAEKTDIFGGAEFPFEIHAGTNIDKYRDGYITETNNPDWYDQHTVYHTPKGDLHMVTRISRRGDPCYTMEHMIKDTEDIDKILSMEYSPFSFDRTSYDDAVAQMGERGIVMISLHHAAYAVHELCGSEMLAYLSIDEEERLSELIQVYRDRILDHTKQILGLGFKEPIFSWVGPEVILPPLMRPDDFRTYVRDTDRPICDAIHNAGGHVWVHSHNKVANFIDDFIDMGVDVLNPLEPPKNGDIDMEDIISRYGNRIGWEGNIEIQEILLSSKERIRDLIDACVDAGWKSGRFILCPSAGYMEYPRPTEQYIENLLFYINYGYEAVERCRRR